MLSLVEGKKILLVHRVDTAATFRAPFLAIQPAAEPLQEGQMPVCTSKKAPTKFACSPSSHLPCTVQDGCPLLPLTAFPSLQQLKEKWVRSSAFFCHKLPCPVFYIFPLLSSFYYLPYFLVLCNYVLGHQMVKQGLLLKAFIISFSIVSSNTSSGFRLTFFLFTTS